MAHWLGADVVGYCHSWGCKGHGCSFVRYCSYMQLERVEREKRQEEVNVAEDSYKGREAGMEKSQLELCKQELRFNWRFP